MYETDFNEMFERIPNCADGNCFFEAMEHLLLGTSYYYENGFLTATEIRQKVADFYKEFNKDIDYPIHTIEYTIKLGILFDNMDEVVEKPTSVFNIEEMPIYHIYNIAHNYVWASMTDVLVCALLFDVNIDLYKKCCEDLISLEEIRSQYPTDDTISIYYNGVNHFEALQKIYTGEDL